MARIGDQVTGLGVGGGLGSVYGTVDQVCKRLEVGRREANLPNSDNTGQSEGGSHAPSTTVAAQICRHFDDA